MEFIIKTSSEELKRAQKWWTDLEMQWKFAYNEAVFGKGTVLEPPKDDELMLLLIRADTFRFAGPMAMNPNLTMELTNLSGLIPLYHIRYLSFTHSKITSLMELVRHKNIENLYVYNNKLTSLNGIEGMEGLKELYIQENQLESIKPIKGLTNLETIYLTRNKLKSLKGLTKKHTKKLKKCYALPNDDLPHSEIIKIQNKHGILLSKG